MINPLLVFSYIIEYYFTFEIIKVHQRFARHELFDHYSDFIMYRGTFTGTKTSKTDFRFDLVKLFIDGKNIVYSVNSMKDWNGSKKWSVIVQQKSMRPISMLTKSLQTKKRAHTQANASVPVLAKLLALYV